MCTRREQITMHVELQKKVMLEILSITHGGNVRLTSAKEVTDLKQGLELLGLSIIVQSLNPFQFVSPQASSHY